MGGVDMKYTAGIILGFMFCLPALGGDFISILDSGGRRATNATCSMDISLGGVVGISSAVSPPVTMKHGYAGQLYEVTNVSLTVSSPVINASSSTQLGALSALDDGTMMILPGSDIVWSYGGFPIDSISSSGIVTAMTVDADVSAVITGRCFGVTRYFTLRILDTTPAHFQIGSLVKQPANWTVTMPASTNRTYTLEFTTNAKTGAWTKVEGQIEIPGSGPTISLSDTNAVPGGFYRVRIIAP